MEYKKNLFFDIEYILYFINNINTFMRFKFFHELIYVLSNNPSYTSMLKEDETSITSTTEFFRRIESCYEKLRLFSKYITRLYRYDNKKDQVNLINEIFDEKVITSFVINEYVIVILI